MKEFWSRRTIGLHRCCLRTPLGSILGGGGCLMAPENLHISTSRWTVVPSKACLRRLFQHVCWQLPFWKASLQTTCPLAVVPSPSSPTVIHPFERKWQRQDGGKWADRRNRRNELQKCNHQKVEVYWSVKLLPKVFGQERIPGIFTVAHTTIHRQAGRWLGAF